MRITSNKKVDNRTLSTDEGLACPKTISIYTNSLTVRTMRRCMHATFLSYKTAKFDKAKALSEHTPPSVRQSKLTRYFVNLYKDK